MDKHRARVEQLLEDLRSHNTARLIRRYKEAYTDFCGAMDDYYRSEDSRYLSPALLRKTEPFYNLLDKLAGLIENAKEGSL